MFDLFALRLVISMRTDNDWRVNMNRLAVSLLLSRAVALSFGTGEARPVKMGLKGAMKAMGSAITIPPEWDGIWATTDSAYDCSDVFIDVSTAEDTICGGSVISRENPLVNFTCTGTATATKLDVICT